jgi:hypothetical protein
MWRIGLESEIPASGPSFGNCASHRPFPDAGAAAGSTDDLRQPRLAPLRQTSYLGADGSGRAKG